MSLAWSLFVNCSLSFLCFFWINGFFLAEYPFSPSRCRTGFTVDYDPFWPASASINTKYLAFFSGVDLYISDQNMCISRTQSPLISFLSVMMAGQSRGVYNCLNWWTWHLQNIWKLHPKMDQSYGAPKFSPWFFWLISFDFPIISNKEADSLRYALKIHH